MVASICCSVAESNTQFTIFNLSEHKKQCLISQQTGRGGDLGTNKFRDSGSNRSVSIGGAVTDSTIVTGDNNAVTKISLPIPETVDIRAELEALRLILKRLETDRASDIEKVLHAAQIEVAKPQPDRNKVGEYIEQALTYASGAAGFGYLVEKLIPPVRSAAAWLGANWYDILRFVGLSP